MQVETRKGSRPKLWNLQALGLDFAPRAFPSALKAVAKTAKFRKAFWRSMCKLQHLLTSESLQNGRGFNRAYLLQCFWSRSYVDCRALHQGATPPLLHFQRTGEKSSEGSASSRPASQSSSAKHPAGQGFLLLVVAAGKSPLSHFHTASLLSPAWLSVAEGQHDLAKGCDLDLHHRLH